jgi:hypothetical protein
MLEIDELIRLIDVHTEKLDDRFTEIGPTDWQG